MGGPLFASVADSSLLSQFWITDDLRQFDRLSLQVDLIKGEAPVSSADAVPVRRPADADVVGTPITRDAVISSLAKSGGGNPLKNTSGQLKLVASAYKDRYRTPESLKNVTDGLVSSLIDDKLADFSHIVACTARMNRFFLKAEERPAEEKPTPDELAAAETALRNMLFTREYGLRALRNRPLDKDGIKALVNAALGVLRTSRERKVSVESVIETGSGRHLDLAKGADVLSLAVDAGRAARRIFVGEDLLRLEEELQAQVAAGDPDGSCARALAAVRELKARREDFSKGLEMDYDIAQALHGEDAEKRTDAVKEKIKKARNELRLFRYETDKYSGRLKKAGLMEWVRRKFDSLHGRLHHKTIVRHDESAYKALGTAEESLRAALGKLKDASLRDFRFHTSDETSADAAAVTHVANNVIRYHLSDREQNLDSFAEKTHEIFDPLMEKGGTREIIFEGGLNAGFKSNTGAAKVNVKAGVKYLRHATLTIEGGGSGRVHVVYRNGVAVEATAAGEANEKKLAGHVNTAEFEAHAEGSYSREKGETFESLDDFILHARGESDFTGKPISGRLLHLFRSIGRGFNRFATFVGLRIRKSALDMHEVRTTFAKAGFLGRLDNLLAMPQADHSVMTKETHGNLFQAQARASVDIGFGPQLGDSHDVFGFGARIGGTWNYREGISEKDFRAYADSVRLESDAFLQSAVDAMKSRNPALHQAYTAAPDAPGRLAVIAKALQRAGNLTADTDEGWRAIATVYRDLALLLAWTRRSSVLDEETEKLLESDIEPLLRSPRADIPEEIFHSVLVDQTATAVDGKAKSFDTEFGFSFDLLASAGSKAAGEALDEVMDTNLVPAGAEALSKGIMEKGLSLKNEIRGSLHHDFAGPDSEFAPWLNGGGTYVSVEAGRSVPADMAARYLAKKLIDVDTGDATATKKETFKDSLKGVGDSIKTAFRDAFGKAKAKEAFGIDGKEEEDEPLGTRFADAGPEVDEPEKADNRFLQFEYRNGRITRYSVGDRKVKGFSFGLRSPVLVGGGVSEKDISASILHTVYVRPDLMTLLSAADDFVPGRGEMFALFLTHNRKAVLRLQHLMNGVEDASDPHREDGVNALRTLAELTANLAEKATHVQGNASFRGRFEKVTEDLRSAETAIQNARDDSIEPMRKLLTAVVNGYHLLGEVKADLEGDAIYSTGSEAAAPRLFTDEELKNIG